MRAETQLKAAQAVNSELLQLYWKVKTLRKDNLKRDGESLGVIMLSF